MNDWEPSLDALWDRLQDGAPPCSCGSCGGKVRVEHLSITSVSMFVLYKCPACGNDTSSFKSRHPAWSDAHGDDRDGRGGGTD